MSSSITSNAAVFNAQGNITTAANRAAASIARLSSGGRIVKASDDVSGLATGTSLRTQVTSLRTALQNASSGTSLLQVADGGLSQIVDILQRQKSIAVQAGSGALTDGNRALLDQEFQNLTAEADRIARTTSFNGVSLLNGGLGTKTRLSTTDTLAGIAVITAPGLDTAVAPVASSKAIQAFTTITGATASGMGNPGDLQITNAAGTVLSDAAYDQVNPQVYGQFSNWGISTVNYGGVGVGTATLSASINGVSFSGVISSSGGANATVLLTDGKNTTINVNVGPVDLTNPGTVSWTQSSITAALSTTTITRTSTLQGIDFAGTALAGDTGYTFAGNAMMRLTSNGSPVISDFTYLSNSGASGSSSLSVQVNGETFIARNVNDSITGSDLEFVSANRTQVLHLNFSGITTNITNIRTDMNDRANFVNALNTGFARAGTGLNFGIGSTQADAITVNYGSAGSYAIYGGQSLNIATATAAANASSVLDGAISKVVTLRASVGALQSRFNFASSAISSSLENQDSARATLLDTDVSAESTAFAGAQMQLQAGIAVLAQANQLPTTLLKLLA